jgi:CheY-like chemotaxis protein
VKSLIEMHGGSVAAASPGWGQGSTITVRLPCVDQPELQAAPKPPEPAAGMGKVLLVDDNHDAADTTSMLLELLGYTVRVAYDPAAALELISEFDPDAAVLDIGLPGMNGYELAAAMRAEPHHFAGLLIALTGYGEQKDKEHALRAGFDAHLTKPADTERLLQLLAAHMNTRQRSTTAL